MRVQRHTTGSVRYDKRRKTWNYLWYEGKTRRSKRIGNKQDFPTKAAAWAEVGRISKNDLLPVQPKGETVATVAAKYEAEWMPTRVSTARFYRSVLSKQVLPKWGDKLIAEVQPRPVELWLRGLPLAPKTKTHIRAMLGNLIKYAMWAGVLGVGVNPMSLVRNPGATKRVRKPRSLTTDEFAALLAELADPYKTIALVCVCLGLRVSEALALQWGDVDWRTSRLSVTRAIVDQIVDEVKTEGSAKSLVLAQETLNHLREWHKATAFRAKSDWVFASPFKLGRLPSSYTGVRTALANAGKRAGLGKVTSHTFRHTYRSWLSAVGTSVEVQQKMMRHSDIRTTMNIYGDVVTNEMTVAGDQVARLAFPQKERTLECALA